MIQVVLGDDAIGGRAGAAIERQDILGRLVWANAQISIRVAVVERQRLGRLAERRAEPAVLDGAQVLDESQQVVPDGVIGRRSEASSSPSTFHSHRLAVSLEADAQAFLFSADERTRNVTSIAYGPEARLRAAPVGASTHS